MKYVIRKIPERDTSFLEREIPEAIVFNDVNHIGALFSFREALKLADDDAVYIQDDMILCRDFVGRTLEYIEKHRNSVIVFSNPYDGGAVFKSKEGFYIPRDAGWLLCTYIPHRIAKMFLEQNENGVWKPSKRAIANQFDDIDFCRWLEYAGEDVFLTVPNLAGHPKKQKQYLQISQTENLPEF